MRFECRICVLRLAFHVFIQIRYEHSYQNRRFNRTSDFLLFSLVFSQMLVFSWFCVCLYLSILGAFFIVF